MSTSTSTVPTAALTRYGRALGVLDIVRELADGDPIWTNRQPMPDDVTVTIPHHLLASIRELTADEGVRG